MIKYTLIEMKQRPIILRKIRWIVIEILTLVLITGCETVRTTGDNNVSSPVQHTSLLP